MPGNGVMVKITALYERSVGVWSFFGFRGIVLVRRTLWQVGFVVLQAGGMQDGGCDAGRGEAVSPGGQRG